MPEITRFEVIDTEGRAVVHYAPVRMEVQDEGRTLKVFLDRPLKLTPAHLTEEERREALEIMQLEFKGSIDANERPAAIARMAKEGAEAALDALLQRYELRKRG